MVRSLVGTFAAVVGFTGLTAVGSATAAQTHSGAIRGHVTDRAGQAVVGADLTLAGVGLHALSDTLGHFFIYDVPPGYYTLAVRRVGFEPKHLTATVFADDTIEATVMLENAATALPTVVSQAATPVQRRLDEYETIRRSGIGTLIDSTQIAKHGGDKLSDVLRSSVTGIDYWDRSCGGTAVAAGNGFGGVIDMNLSKKIKIMNIGGCKVPNACYYQVYVDGSRVYSYSMVQSPPDIDGLTNLSGIAAVEIFKSGAAPPAEYNSTGAACGTIAIWLKR